MKRQQLLSYTRKAVDEYNMIEEGDKIAIGLSGGKDSLALLIALGEMRRFYPKKYEVVAIMVSLGFPDNDYKEIEEFCDRFNVDLHVVETNIGQIIFEDRKEENPCSLCSKLKKGALNDKAKELGCTRVALGHHIDDVIETFFMSLFYNGKIHTFAPVVYWDRIDLYAIRPLLFCEESEIISFMEKEELPVMKNPCLADGVTKREELKTFVTKRSEEFTDFRKQVFGAIRRSDIKGWNVDELL